MGLFDDLKNDEIINSFIVPECEDEGICVEIDETVADDSILIIKVDDYYNSLKIEKRPASVDCLIIQKCGDGKYQLFLVELKNVEAAKHINRKNLVEKFETSILDFLSNLLRTHFFNSAYQFKKLRLILSAGKVKSSDIKKYELDFLLGLRLFKFQNKIIGINGIPPHPLMKRC